jgi:5-methylcytosine-specific restriction endonuclease McrA
MHASGLDPRDWEQYPGSVLRELRRKIPNGVWGAGRTARWLNVTRRMLVQRDGPQCHRCGWDATDHVNDWLIDPAWGFPFDVDHVIPLAADGEHALSNMQLLCGSCHRQKTIHEMRERR